MFFSRKRKPGAAISVALLASLAFLALAVWGWGMPLATVGEFLLISSVLMLVIMAAAAGVVFLFKFLQRLRQRG